METDGPNGAGKELNQEGAEVYGRNSVFDAEATAET
jgi:hypothetical protein